MDPLALIVVVVALLLGLAAGWFLGMRPVGEWKARLATREAEARELDEKFKALIRDLAAASMRAERVDGLERELSRVRETHAAAVAELATLREKTANFDEQKRLLIDA